MDKNQSFSIRKLTKNYLDIYNEKISKSLVHNILKKKIGYRYLKTCLKNERANTIISKRQKFFFIKIISRIILFKGNLIFLDECGFCNYNCNYRIWRKKDDIIYQELKENEKFNLLMAVTKNKVVYYHINKEVTDTNTFKKFMEDMIHSMDKDEIAKSVFIMDNLACHKTIELFNFYYDNHLKVLFNAPYISQFNIIEFVFRHIKNYTYKKLYNSIKALEKDVCIIINSDILKKLWKETLNKYISFYNNNKHFNLNSLNS